MIAYYNGGYQPKDAVRISPDDRGFLLGDGVYEVTRTYQGRLFALERHLARLSHSLHEMRIGGLRVEDVGEISRQLLTRNGLEQGHALVYFQVTRGAAPRTHGFPPGSVPPTVYGYAAPIVARVDAAVGVAAVTVPDTRWARCDIKSTSLVANCLANQRAQDAGAFEALFVRDGVALEGTHTSLFAVLNGEVRTVPLTNYVLPGITRAIVLELARAAGLATREAPLFLDALRSAEEVFLAGTTAEVLPVVRIDGQPVASGTPGPVTRRLRELFLAETTKPTLREV